MRILAAACGLLISTVSLASGQVTGRWKSFDETTGKQTSVIEIFEKDGMIFGKIESINTEAGENPDPVCHGCPGEYKDQPITGMTILKNMKMKKTWSGTEWSGGTIFKPSDKREYSCKLWLDADENLKVRGYLGVAYKTQTWTPAD